MKTDVLVIGCGIAGLSFAIKTALAKPQSQVMILSKANPYASNTSHAQGGIAVVLDHVKDSFEKHIEDTMKAGKGLSDPEVVRMVVSQAPERLQELISWGTDFDLETNGSPQLGLEGGHSQHRIVHHRDLTGLELARKLYKKATSLPNICFKEQYFATDLITLEKATGNICTGAKVLDLINEEAITISSKITFLASGGSGMLFQKTTNPSVATADGIAMAHRAGAQMRDMQYMQFHPTALYEEEKHSLFLISEAVRGYGAHLVDGQGKRFLFRYDLRGELATRDIVSSAIVEELKKSGEKSVYLDCRHLEAKAFRQHFPSIAGYAASIGLDFTKDLLPVVPAAHYLCGGIEVDHFARTSIKNLFAAGECAYTGLHGANRLASNSLLEAVVYSHQAASLVQMELDHIQIPFTAEEQHKPLTPSAANQKQMSHYHRELTKIMTYEVLHTYSLQQKRQALEDLAAIKEQFLQVNPKNSNEPRYYELRNMMDVAMLIVQHSVCANIPLEERHLPRSHSCVL